MRLRSALLLAAVLLAAAPHAQTARVDTTLYARPAHRSGPPPPYPVIFVHGLWSKDLTWQTTIAAFEDAGWGAPYSYHVDINASTSMRYSDDFRWTLPVSYWQFPARGTDSLLVASPNQARPLGSTTTSRLFAVNFNAYYDAASGNIVVHRNRNISGHSESYCAAVAKQGYALGVVIKDVLAWTGSDRVILVGHSMGGLAIREYLQRRSPGGTHTWWADPASHHVAAAITTGTPHQGSNASLLGAAPCYDTEALRDLRYTFVSTGETSPYLYGGTETIQAYWHNDDVNADGDVLDTVIGLNAGTPASVLARDNPAIPLPRDVRYYYLFSGSSLGIGDGVVDMERQVITELGPDGLRYYAPYGSAVGRRVDVTHWNQPDDVAAIEDAIRYSAPVAAEGAPGVAAPPTVFPNPTAGPLTVTYDLDRSARVGVILIDALGRVVLSVPEQAAAAGAGEARFDATALPAGVYAVSLTVDGVAQPARRVAVVR